MDTTQTLSALVDSLARMEQRLAAMETTLAETRSLVGPFGCGLPDGSMLVQTLHGTKYFIDPMDEIMAPQLIVYRQWEADLSAYVVHSVDRDSVVVDVGANFGYFTCLAASRIGTSGSGQVIAVEPNPKMSRLLKRNVKVNWSMCPITVHDCAVAERSGYLEFYVPANRSANAGLARPIGAADAERMIVPTRTVDELGITAPVQLMKIDVEGFELAVLRGARATIQQSPDIHIIIEWSPEQMQGAGFSVDDAVALFDQLGLEAWRLPPHRHLSAEQWQELHIPASRLREMGYDNIVLRRA